MIRGLLVAALLLLVPGFASAQELFPLQAVPVSGCQPPSDDTILPTPPAGYCWQRTFDEEFQTQYPNSGTAQGPVTVNTAIWNIAHACGGANWTDTIQSPQYGCAYNIDKSNTVAPGGPMSMQMNSSTADGYNSMTTGSLDIPPGYWPGQPGLTFSQRYGFFVYKLKLPSPALGEFDIELQGVGSFTPQYSNHGIEYSWITQGGYGDYNYSFLYYYENGQGSPPTYDTGVDLTQSFNQLGAWWKGPESGDGTAHGSMYNYFNGTQMTGQYPLADYLWDNGAFFSLFWAKSYDGHQCDGPNLPACDPVGTPIQVEWIRAYRLVAQ